jgi:dinuclear metal center YbgI/SA1388 family protein
MVSGMADRDMIVGYLDERLDTASFEDASVNGLQVAGAREVSRVAVATDAAVATYRKAVAAGCQMIVAHHGLIWGGIRRVTGRARAHLEYLIRNDLNLYAAHLPLDAHPEIGNNALLASQAGLIGREPFGAYHGVPLGFMGRLPEPVSLEGLAAAWEARTGREPKVLAFGAPVVERVGIVSGRGGVLGEAIERGLDCLITGEGIHEDHHAALEGGINVIYLGHYASETLGVRAVGDELAARFGVEPVFIDEPTAF